MFNSKAATGLCFALVLGLGACAQQSEPVRIQAEPIFNKFGEVTGCSDGRTPNQSTDSTGQTGIDQVNPCLPPEEECVETSASSNYPCLPLRPGDDDDPQRPTGTPNSPTGAP